MENKTEDTTSKYEIIYNVDWVSESDKLFRIAGWGYGSTKDNIFGQIDFEVLDSNKRSVDFSVHRIYRKDINEQDAFGYEIGWEKQPGEMYTITCKYKDVEKVTEYFDKKTDKFDPFLNKNTWILPAYKFVNGKARI